MYGYATQAIKNQIVVLYISYKQQDPQLLKEVGDLNSSKIAKVST